MKRKKVLMFLILLINLFLLGCSSNLSEPGYYSFDNNTYSKYIDIKVDYPKEKDYPSAVNSIDFFISVSPTEQSLNNNCIFENCTMTIKITVNEVIENVTLHLNDDGYCDENITIFFNDTYTVNTNYKIINTTGEVYIKPYDDVLFIDNNIKYKYIIDDFGIRCIRITPYNYKTEIIYFNKYANTINGQVRIDIDFSRCISSAFMNCSLNVNTIIFDDHYYMKDFINFFSYLYEHFPNLHTIVIKSISGNFEEVYLLDFNFPENSVKLYYNDNTDSKIFTEYVKEATFVQGCYTYDEYNF